MHFLYLLSKNYLCVANTSTKNHTIIEVMGHESSQLNRNI